MAESNNLVLKKISNITGLNFFIPSFQRGYRWDIMQVEDLLNDIKEYIDIENKESFLCLQPVVVYEKGEKYVVIDGQQRLTTIAIIKHYFKMNDIYRIEYEKNGNFLADLLDNITYTPDKLEQELYTVVHDNMKNRQTHSLDEYHIILSYLTIARYFNELEDKDKYIDDFKKLFSPTDDNNSIQFIWYNVTDEIQSDEKKAIEIFTRLNIGKIPLTDAELIKALFLKKDNFKESEIDKKLHIAYKWDEIEKTLNNDTFWYFISNKDEDEDEIKKRNRIELILELAIRIKNGKNHELFKEYENKFKQINNENKDNKDNTHNLDKLWQEIEECFMTLKEWYNNNEMYHYIGYYLCFEENIYTMYSTLKDLNYIEKKSKLIEKIKDNILFKVQNSKLEDMDYTHAYIEEYYKENKNDNYFLNLDFNEKEHKSVFHKILLFIDVYNYILRNNSNCEYGKSTSFFIDRYPFDIFKYENKKYWSLEHIASQKNPVIKDRLDHIRKISEGIKDININIYNKFDKEIIKCIGEYTKNDIVIENDKWEKVLFIIDYLNIDDLTNYESNTNNTYVDTEIYKHRICNIALLQKDLNSKLNNNPFMIKRKMLLDISNRFIPDNTINVFSKRFNKNADTLIFWQKSDMLSYGCYILNTLKKFSQGA